MNKHNAITTAIHNATRELRYPGPWVEWRETQPMNDFLMELMQRPAVPESSAWGRTIWRSPIRDALSAMPFLYRGAVHQLMARHFYNLLVDGEQGESPVEACRQMHDNLSMIRSLLAARLRTNHDEFAEATTPVEVAHQHAWQQDVEPTDASAEGTTVWAGCSLEQALDDFAEALGAGEMNWATSIVVRVAGADQAEFNWDGWEKVALDRIPVEDNRRKKLKSRIGVKRHNFWTTNALYRALVKEKWTLESLRETWEWRLDRATQQTERPHGEAYAGADPEMLQIGRIEHVVADEGFDGTGHREGGPEREVINLIESELADLRGLLELLESEQRRQTPIWKMLGYTGVPFWYASQDEYFTIDEQQEALTKRQELRDEWFRTRDVVASSTLTKEELKLLAELARFDG